MSGPHDVPGEHAGGPDGTPGRDDGASVGSVAEEAAKLFGALAGLAREHAPDLGEGLSGLADHAERASQESDAHGSGDHGAGASAECTWCPVCRTVHLVRQTSPEVRAHLASAVTSLARAAAGLLATAVPDEGPTSRSGVEHIDLDGDPDENHDENHDGGQR
ncbi:hypothetical protein GHK92_11585 [Nocardioides sp. dk4132]|uniref:hypothetical protein n=1 Tax=unclassified Nocardioides TaxID=2615069 RepID=UPI00129553CD|nr:MULTISPECIES: hypothetical protein [unclassified Nocardioides]MQW76519.1 hypothetical protein [Nocardioides sp. dk4132]QGA07220.1 hypothetical protein GFH29_07355 [Nocardioides sp. dk884]